MANISEVNSFVGKFFNLWKCGRDATMQLETQAGQACVTSRHGLGEHPHQQHRKNVSPSRQRCLQKEIETEPIAVDDV
jgi:hypothetical protein